MDKQGEDTFKDGVRLITLDSWYEFHPIIQIKNPDLRIKKLQEHLDYFKICMEHAFPNVLPEDDISIWALGQHYGLKTPLIDWTYSPYIAAYFAFIEEANVNDGYRYIYALNRSIERLLSKKKKAADLLSTDRSVLFIDELPFSNPRFSAQKSLFTKAFQGNDIWEYVQTFSRKRPTQEILVKIRIPTRDRQECLNELHSRNIDQTSLLLDFRTVVDQCNSKL
jgi:hypothetical protein